MFFCGDFCNSGLEEPEILVSNYQEVRDLERMKSQIRNSEIKPGGGAFAMIRRSKYKEFREQCRRSNTKFVDRAFPADKNSLNFSVSNRDITWKRISEIIPNCVMEQSGIDPADIQQGNIGDCYFLASISALAQNPQRIRNIFLDNFEIDGHCIYKVIACVDGIITEMVIDDYIPVYASTNRPVFCKANGREVWAMLLEKAWAKIKGSYGALSQGTPHQVLNAFAVAPCSYFQVDQIFSEQYKDIVWQRLMQASDFNQPTCVGSRQKVILQGLKTRHTYTVLTCVNVAMGGHNHRLMRMRNPWGQTEYTGFASESDTKFWGQVPKETKDKILPKREADDGDFVLPFSEFIRNFDSIDICHVHDDYCFQFQPIKMTRCKPAFVRLVVDKQEHEAYITFEKVFQSEEAIQQLKKTGQYGYSRIIIGRDIGEQKYEYFSSKMQTNFGDLTIRCRLVPGTYVIYLQADYPAGIEKFHGVFSYYYSRLSDRGNKQFSVMQGYDQSTFLHEVMLNHAHRMSADINKLSARPNDWIKSTLLYENGGYGYVACSLQKQTNFKLHISIDDTAIEREGFKLMTPAATEQDVQPGTVKVYVFEMDLRNKNVDQLSFPPQGFRISKIV